MKYSFNVHSDAHPKSILELEKQEHRTAGRDCNTRCGVLACGFNQALGLVKSPHQNHQGTYYSFILHPRGLGHYVTSLILSMIFSVSPSAFIPLRPVNVKTRCRVIYTFKNISLLLSWCHGAEWNPYAKNHNNVMKSDLMDSHINRLEFYATRVN